VGPTILEAAGIPEPKIVDGIAQNPMEGTSFLYSFDDANAAERHTVQYFEIYGNRAIYKDGWWAASMFDRIPWDASPPSIGRFAPGVYDPEQDRWELYYLPDDFAQAKDVAAENPEKLAELKQLFWEEAEKHNVLPLLAGFSIFFGILPPMPTATTHTFHGDVQNIASGMIPRIYGRSYAIEAELSIPEQGAEGVIVAEADEMGGFSLWVDEKGLLHHSYSMMGVEQYKHVSTEPIPTGDITVRMQFDADKQERSAGGTVSLYANDRKIGEGRLEKTVFFRFSGYSGMDVGRDNGLVVDRAYAAKAPYAFTGTIKKVVFDLKPATHGDEKALHEAAAHAAAAHGISA
jgi:arylsulfatase